MGHILERVVLDCSVVPKKDGLESSTLDSIDVWPHSVIVKSGQAGHDSSPINPIKKTLSYSPSHCKIYVIDSLSGL